MLDHLMHSSQIMQRGKQEKETKQEYSSVAITVKENTIHMSGLRFLMIWQSIVMWFCWFFLMQ